jgi:mannan endo-1,4-beta-mannosidase
VSQASLSEPVGPLTPERSREFIRVEGGKFVDERGRHCFVGANMWFAAYLGRSLDGRERLRRELDRLQEIGVKNLRILGSSELSPLKSAIRPAFRDASKNFSEELLQGLDFALSELRVRGQRAVVYLTNFWEWSGGMMTYLYYTDGKFVDMDDPLHPWPAFPDYAARFYSSAEAVSMYHDYVQALVTRTNSVTGHSYKNDPTIFSWQLANEPRPGVTAAVAEKNVAAYVAWISDTARLIKSLDPNHMVSTGSEGLVGSANRAEYFVRAHEVPEVDYLTAHIWPQNWGWIEPADLPRTFNDAERLTRSYIAEHVELAKRLKRPLVIEEFGFPRDDARFDREATTTYRNRFYKVILDAVLENSDSGGPLSGSNFWAFGGEGRASHSDFRMRPGDTSYLGDPSHEPQGWYSVFDSDGPTLDLLRDHARALEGQSSRR